MLYASLLPNRNVASLFHRADRVIGILDLPPELLLEGNWQPLRQPLFIRSVTSGNIVGAVKTVFGNKVEKVLIFAGSGAFGRHPKNFDLAWLCQNNIHL